MEGVDGFLFVSFRDFFWVSFWLLLVFPLWRWTSVGLCLVQ